MNQEDVKELTGLTEWLSTFPQLEPFPFDKENNSVHTCVEFLSNPSMASAVLDVALEVCNVEDSDTVLGHSEDVWDTTLSLTRRIVPSSKRKSSLEQGSSHWNDSNKHVALGNLLTIAVSHKNLLLRKAYIERIMTCSSSTQRLLMSLIERNKRATLRRKTPSKTSSKKRPKDTPQSTTTKKTTSVAESLLASPTNHALSTPPKSNFFKDTVGSATNRSTSVAIDSSFHQRKSVYENKTPPSTYRPTSATGRSENHIKSAKNGHLMRGGSLSTPNFLRRGDHSEGGNNESFSSPVPRSSAKPAPPSSEQFHRGGNGIFSPGLGDTAEYETQVQNLRDENQDLARQLEKSRQKEEEFSKNIDEIESKFRQEMLKVEREAREQIELSKEEYQNHISQVQRELAQITEEYSKARKERDELSKLKDEMEVMAHAKSQLEETTERLRTYKEKVQQLTDIKEALQREEEAHARSVDENLRLKNELQALQPLKRQLEEYKEKAIDMEVRYTDCYDELTKLKEQKSSSSDINQQMEQYVLAQEEEIQELRRRVAQNESAAKEGGGVGDGISELNPEFKAEVLSLRNENMQLRAFAQKREADEVVKLEQEVEEKTMLSERYKTQFLSTKNQLEDTIISLEESKDRENKLQLELEEKNRVSERFKSQYLNTKEQLESTQMSLQESKSRESKLRGELADSFSKIKVTQEEIEELSSQLIKCTEDLNAGISRESKLEEELAVWAGEAKTTQEHANDLSRRLKKSHAELEESHNRESALLEQVSQFKSDLEALEVTCNDLSEELQETRSTLEQSQARETALEKNVTEWTNRAEESHEHAKNVSSQLVKCQKDLEASKEKVAELEANLLEVSALKDEAEQMTEQLQHELNETTKTLEETFVSLQESKDSEMSLKNEIADLQGRIEDAEIISKQRMELVQTTREKLEALEKATELLESEKKDLLSDLTNLSEAREEAQQNVENLENELEETHSALNDTEEKLSEAQALAEHLKAEVDASTAENQVLKEKVSLAEDLTTKLQDELVETRELLSTAQQEIKTVKESKASSDEEVERSQKKIEELEDKLKKEVDAKNDTLMKLEDALLQSKKVKEDMESEQENLSKQLHAEQQKVAKMKQELDTCKDSLDAMHATLGSSQHREKMLKHEITKLEDKLRESEKELADTRTEIEVSLKESSQSLDTVRQALNAKAAKELAELQQNMNQLLDDERLAKRQQDEVHKEQMRLLTENHEDQIKSLRKENEELLRKNKEKFDSEIGRIQAEYDQVRANMEKSAEEETAKLMEKGKGMMKEIKEKLEKEKQDLADDVQYLTEQVMKEEDDKKRLGIQFQTKIVEYKKKLQAATGRINALASDNNEFEERVKLLERERAKLREENDRYRRQLGGRSGSDSVMQNQLEMLQNEFQSAIDENRELKKKLQSQGLSSMSSIGEDSSSGRYTRSRAGQQSTLAQLRADYEETIDSLNDEKRELVMKNSAAVTDVQKAEKRAWEVEQENAKLKQDLTSLKLSNERLERLLSNIQDDAENLGHVSTYSNMSISEMSPIPQPPSDLGEDNGMEGSHRNEGGILSTSKDHGNASLSGDKYSATGVGFTSPDLATKRWVQSASLHTPYRSRPINHKMSNDPPDT